MVDRIPPRQREFINSLPDILLYFPSEILRCESMCSQHVALYQLRVWEISRMESAWESLMGAIKDLVIFAFCITPRSWEDGTSFRLHSIANERKLGSHVRPHFIICRYQLKKKIILVKADTRTYRCGTRMILPESRWWHFAPRQYISERKFEVACVADYAKWKWPKVRFALLSGTSS